LEPDQGKKSQHQGNEIAVLYAAEKQGSRAESRRSMYPTPAFSDMAFRAPFFRT
jgi:hypothetical protein